MGELSDYAKERESIERVRKTERMYLGIAPYFKDGSRGNGWRLQMIVPREEAKSIKERYEKKGLEVYIGNRVYNDIHGIWRVIFSAEKRQKTLQIPLRKDIEAEKETIKAIKEKLRQEDA